MFEPDTYGDSVFAPSPYDEQELYEADPYGDVYGDDVDEDEERTGRHGVGRLGLMLGIVAVVLVFLILIVGFYVTRQISSSGSPGEPVEVELESGQSTAEIAQVLNDHGVIGDPRVFTLYARFRSQGDIQAGQYELQTNMAMGDVLDALADGPDWAEQTVTLREGLTVDQILSTLADPEEGAGFEAEDLQAAIADPSVRSQFLPQGQENLEGTLFPETYGVPEDATALELLQVMVEKFDEVYAELEVDARAADVGRANGYEVLTVASMIEMEAGTEEDRPKIARVIYNRLEADAPLAIDSTSCYEKGEQPCELTAEDLASDSPYNTRESTGLPPTPIASPGRASIEAALQPAEGDWFYYVLDVEADDGSHLFTADRDEFNAARDRCVEAGRCG